MSYDICSSSQCNICLLLKIESARPLDSSADVVPAVSLRRPTTLTCNGCHLVHYCNTEHQTLDWPLHRKFCRGIQKIMNDYDVKHPYLLNGQPQNHEQMERTILQVKFLLKSYLGRNLQFHEEELTSFPQYCQVCFSFRRLQLCSRCLAVSYCSEKHALEDQPSHNRKCGLLQLYYCPYKTQQLSCAIFEFHQRVPDLHKTDLFGAFQRATLKKLPTNPTESLKNYQLFDTAADFSCIGTICYSLSFTDMGSYDNSKFVIFIVGATFEQQLWFQNIHTRFFFLQYPIITQLCLYFIGPEAEGEARKNSDFNFQGQRRYVNYSTYRGLFQDFSKEFNIKPSLIISFNCGFSEYMNEYQEESHTNNDDEPSVQIRSVVPSKDTWSRGILDMLLTFDAPIVFTSYTSQEADFDYATVLRVAQTDKQSIRVKRIFNVKRNPFRDLRPCRSWRDRDDDEIYYRNGYVQALLTRFET